MRLINTPCITKRVHDIHLFIHNCNSSFLSYIIKTNNTIRDTLRLNKLDPPYLSCWVAVSTTACFCINSYNINNSKRVSWNNTTLIKFETKLLFCFCFIHETFIDLSTWINNTVGLIFDSTLFLFCQWSKMSNIKMCNFRCLLCTILPNVRSKYFSAWSEYNMSSSMMSLKLLSSIFINSYFYLFAFKFINTYFNWSIKCMKHTLSNLDSINNFEGSFNSFNCKSSCIMLLTSWCRINSWLIKDK